MPVSSSLGREQRGEGREVQRHALEPRGARPRDRRADQPLVEAVRRRAQTRHRRQRERRHDAGEIAKCRKPVACPSGSNPITKSASSSPSREQRVERHHEATLGRCASPGARDRLQLVPQRGRRARSAAARGATKPGVRQAVHGLAHLADRRGRRARTSPSRRPPRRRGRARAAHARGRAASASSDAPRIAIRQSRACAYSTKRCDQRRRGARAGRSGRPRRSRRRRRRGRRGRRDSSSAKKYDLSARRTNGASVSTPHACTRARASARSRSSWTTPVPPRREPAGDAPRGRGDAEQEQREREPVAELRRRSAASRARSARTRPSNVSRAAKRPVNGWSAAMRLSHSAPIA